MSIAVRVMLQEMREKAHWVSLLITLGGRINNCAADQAQSVLLIKVLWQRGEECNENQAAKFVTAMTSWSVDGDGGGGGGGVTADVNGDTAMNHHNINTASPPPSVDDSAARDLYCQTIRSHEATPSARHRPTVFPWSW